MKKPEKKTAAAADISNRTADSSVKKAMIRILILYAVSFAVHVILHMWILNGPTVIIDEGLYTNIARSLAWEGRLAFRSQPINYPYLLYPFLLVPVYWLNWLIGGDIYRYVQIFNTLMITSSVIPVYLFANDFSKDQAKALTAAVIVSVMPDMIFGGYLMVECIMWPLALWMVWACWRAYNTGEQKYWMLTALFTGLMFSTKPGAIAVGAVLLGAGFILNIKKHEKMLWQAILPLVLLACVIGAVYGIYLLLYGAESSLIGLYAKQTSEWDSKDILVAIEGTFLLIFLFIFGCGGYYAIVPYTHLKKYDAPRRQFILIFAVSLFAVIVGTAIFVVPYKWTGELGKLPLHLRYCAMYIPVMYVFTVSTDAPDTRSKGFIPAMLAFIVLSLFPGARAGFVKGETIFIDSPTLEAFINGRNINGNVTGWILTAAVVLFTAYVIRMAIVLGKSRGSKKSSGSGTARMLQRSLTVYLVLFMVYNAACAYSGSKIPIKADILSDAREVNQMVGDRECLGITQRYYDDIYTYWQESRMNHPMQQVTIDQMYVSMQDTGGVYTPFVPVDQSPNIHNHETPDTDTFVLSMTIAEHMELRDTVEAQKTTNGNFTVARITPGERWVDTMMYGLDKNALLVDTPSQIRIYDKNRNIDGNLILTLTISGNGTLVIGDNRLSPEGKTKAYTLTLPFKNTVNLKAEGATVQVIRYTTQKAGN